jgi:uncharacterized SAM-binding protein YcdF (DUF218 family)
VTRLVAVLGYSDGTTQELHAVCRARLARAADEAGPEDVVLFTGWARRPGTRTEADLMAAGFVGEARARLVDRGARTTLGNAIAVARAARLTGAEEVVVITTDWHARRAGALVRAALAGRGTRLRVAAVDAPDAPARRLREAAAWLLVPLFALVAARTR